MKNQLRSARASPRGSRLSPPDRATINPIRRIQRPSTMKSALPDGIKQMKEDLVNIATRTVKLASFTQDDLIGQGKMLMGAEQHLIEANRKIEDTQTDLGHLKRLTSLCSYLRAQCCHCCSSSCCCSYYCCSSRRWWCWCPRRYRDGVRQGVGAPSAVGGKPGLDEDGGGRATGAMMSPEANDLNMYLARPATTTTSSDGNGGRVPLSSDLDEDQEDLLIVATPLPQEKVDKYWNQRYNPNDSWLYQIEHSIEQLVQLATEMRQVIEEQTIQAERMRIYINSGLTQLGATRRTMTTFR